LNANSSDLLDKVISNCWNGNSSANDIADRHFLNISLCEIHVRLKYGFNAIADTYNNHFLLLQIKLLIMHGHIMFYFLRILLVCNDILLV